MKKENIIIDIIIPFVFFAFMAFLFVSFLAWIQYAAAENICERYSNYGYTTKLDKFLGYEPYNCAILMEDGTWIHSYDFEIADYRKPLMKGE